MAINLNSYNQSPMQPVHSGPRLSTGLGDDVAASIRAFFKANIVKILDELRDRGVKQKAIAEEFGVGPTAISQMKSGAYFPSPEQMDRLLEVLNKHMPVEYEDLFRDPAKKQSATKDLIAELARRAGYDLKKT